MEKSLRELKIGTYDNIETADEKTCIKIESLGLLDIFAKFDLIVSVTWSWPISLTNGLTLVYIPYRIPLLRRSITMSMSRCARRTRIATSGSMTTKSAIWTSRCTRSWSALCAPRWIAWSLSMISARWLATFRSQKYCSIWHCGRAVGVLSACRIHCVSPIRWCCPIKPRLTHNYRDKQQLVM